MNFLHNPAFPKELLIPIAGIEVGDRLRYQFDEGEIKCHVVVVIRKGPNFSYCSISMDSLDASSPPLRI